MMAARNRPRSNFARDDADESSLWNSIVEKIRKCRDLNEKFQQTQAAIQAAQEKLDDSDASAQSIATLEEIEKLHREGIKAAEDELKVLLEEPEDLLRNLDTLISVRSAFEAEPTPVKAQPNGKAARNLKRARTENEGPTDSSAPTPESTTPAAPRTMSKTASRSGSVAAASIKSEAATDVVVDLSDKQPKFAVGSDVFYKTKKNQEGEGILCRIINIVGEGKAKRYEIQDSDPEPEAANEPPWRVTAQSLVPIPVSSAGLPPVTKGKQVFAVYPQTTTFYKAEVVGTRKDSTCRLRFEGEDDNATEQEVERRFVLDLR